MQVTNNVKLGIVVFIGVVFFTFFIFRIGIFNGLFYGFRPILGTVEQTVLRPTPSSTNNTTQGSKTNQFDSISVETFVERNNAVAAASQLLGKITIEEKRLQEKTLQGKVKFYDLKIGSGAKVENNSNIVVGYVGFIINKKESTISVFDSNTSFPVVVGGTGIIPGFSAGLLGMRQGGRRLIEIAPEAAYGSEGVTGSIPPNTAITFLVEVYNFVT